jgi:hypothetical protein
MKKKNLQRKITRSREGKELLYFLVNSGHEVIGAPIFKGIIITSRVRRKGRRNGVLIQYFIQ